MGYHVGGTMNRYEYVVSGQPINDMSHAANESSAGEVVLSKSSYRQLRLSIPKQYVASPSTCRAWTLTDLHQR